jgi:SSS family solute:Na+ symporter
MLLSSISVLIFIALLWFLGWYAKRWVTTDSDYLLAGRQVSIIPGVAGICGVAFAGSVTSIIPGVTIQYGFMGWIWGVTLPLVVGYSLYGLLAAPYIRRSGAYTLPEWLEVRFDARTRLVVSIASLIGLTGVVAMNIMAMALILVGFLNAPLWLMITLVLVGHLIFIVLGGLWALTLTDVVQVLLGFTLLPGLVAYCAWTFGGWDMIQTQFVTSTPLTQGIDGTFPWFNLSYPSVITVFLVLGMFIQWGGNYYWLRAASARTESVARYQYLIGGVLVAVVVHAALGMLGLYAGSLYREEFLAQANPMSAYGMLLRHFPPGITVVGLVTAFAATISTTSNAHMGITATLVRDLYQRFLRPEASSDEVLRMGRILTVLTGAGIWALSFYPGGPYLLLAVSCALLGPAALIFFFGRAWAGMTSAGAFWGALIGMITMLIYEGLRLTGVLTWSAHTVIIGTAVTLPLIIGISLLKPNTTRRSAPTELHDAHHLVLDLLQRGYTQMVEITDFLSIDSSQANHLVEDLIASGLVERQAPRGLHFFTLALTAKGQHQLQNNAAEDPLGLQVLEQIATQPQALPELNTTLNLQATTLGAVVSRLERLGYLRNHGIWQRQVSLSEKGHAVLAASRQAATPASTGNASSV